MVLAGCVPPTFLNERTIAANFGTLPQIQVEYRVAGGIGLARHARSYVAASPTGKIRGLAGSRVGLDHERAGIEPTVHGMKLQCDRGSR